MTRKVFPCKATVKSLLQDNKPIENLKEWLVEQAKEHKLCYLLAHADDGVIWGRVDNGVLVTSFDAAKGDADFKKYCPDLLSTTLQQARLFNDQAELLLWVDGDNDWHARLIQDIENTETPIWESAFDELQMLWGDYGSALKQNFTLLEEGIQGLRHAIPVEINKIPADTTDNENPKLIPPKLIVRHYLAKDDFAQVAVSRLVGFEIMEGDQK